MCTKDMCYKFADYLINKYNTEKLENAKNKNGVKKDMYPLSNKRLQKMLFIATIIYAVKYRKGKLFSDDFYAWDYGPVMPEIYSQYSKFQYGEMLPLTNEFGNLSKEEKKALDLAYNSTINVPLDLLIQRTHEAGTPWQDNYNKELGPRIIPFAQIKKYYKKRKNFNHLINFDDDLKKLKEDKE